MKRHRRQLALYAVLVLSGFVIGAAATLLSRGSTRRPCTLPRLLLHGAPSDASSILLKMLGDDRPRDDVVAFLDEFDLTWSIDEMFSPDTIQVTVKEGFPGLVVTGRARLFDFVFVDDCLREIVADDLFHGL